MTVEARTIRLVMELRGCGVTDTRVLSAIERIPRELFVPEPFLDQAYEDVALPIGSGQTLSQPSVVARMIQALEVGERMKMLEVGTGSGYQTAVLAQLCRRVYTVERHRQLLHDAEKRFAKLRLYNITSRVGDGTEGWAEQAPFERILVSAASPEIPEALVAQLGEGGVMMIPLGADYGEQSVTRVVRRQGDVEAEALWPVRFVPLRNGPAP
ncbi:MAG: protein-L-isoaspartate(D-aspartate) O-methyltransferase [Alphaproteobacteria bacterium]